MQHAHWIAQARQHWKEFQPAKFKRLQEAGTLDQELKLAAQATADEMATLRKQGATELEAWEMVREQHLFPPEEADSREPMEPSPGYAAQLDVNQSLGSLTMPGERET